jgi:hypothetical protein
MQIQKVMKYLEDLDNVSKNLNEQCKSEYDIDTLFCGIKNSVKEFYKKHKRFPELPDSSIEYIIKRFKEEPYR